eukprot:1261917-Rhodomonas_salina.1
MSVPDMAWIGTSIQYVSTGHLTAIRYVSTGHLAAIRYVSTGHGVGAGTSVAMLDVVCEHLVPPYPTSVPDIAYGHTPARYRTSHRSDSTIPYLSTTDRIGSA